MDEHDIGNKYIRLFYFTGINAFTLIYRHIYVSVCYININNCSRDVYDLLFSKKLNIFKDIWNINDAVCMLS